MSPRPRFPILSLTLVLLVLPTSAFTQPVAGVLGIATEVAPIEKRLEDSREITVRGYTFRRGTLKGRQVMVGRSGTGKVNAAVIATLLIDHFNPSTLLFSGTAGAVDPALLPGDVVIGATVAQHDAGVFTPDGLARRGLRNAVTGERDPLLVPAPETLLAAGRRSARELKLPRVKTAEGDRVPRIVEGLIVTGDVFMTNAARREELWKSLGASAVEMEGGAVVQVCRQFGVPCLVVRSITDHADERAMASYKEFLQTSSENAATLVAAIIAGLEQ